MQETRRAPVARRGAARARTTLAITALLVAVMDQLSKQWALSALVGGRRIPLIGDVLGFRLVFNTGSAFGLFEGLTLMLFVLSSIILVAVAVWGWTTVQNPAVVGLVLGGGAGNLIDRIIRPPAPFRGAVVDFIELSFWPTFNIADSAIVIGVCLLLIANFKRQPDPQ